MILDRAFATYLVRDQRAARWIRVFEHRFLSDEAFVQTVLMHSPFKDTLVNHNLRYIYRPHFDGDPTHYWQRMGYAFIGGPQVINASGIPSVLRSPYMFARKVDPTVDSRAVQLWDDWMARKLQGERPDDQAVLGGSSREDTGRGEPLERTPVRAPWAWMARWAAAPLAAGGARCSRAGSCAGLDRSIASFLTTAPRVAARLGATIWRDRLLRRLEGTVRARQRRRRRRRRRGRGSRR